MSEYENLMWRNSLIINNPTEFCGHSDDLVSLKFDILDPQADAFHQSHSRSIQQPSNQLIGILYRREQPLDLLPRQHHRQ